MQGLGRRDRGAQLEQLTRPMLCISLCSKSTAVPAETDLLAPAQQAFHAARQHVGEALSAFEFFDEAALDVALQHVPGLQHPTPNQPVQ